MDIRACVLACLAEVAPEAEAEFDTLEGDADLREQLDLDSMDFLNVLIAIARETGVEVPERDYALVRSLDALVAYVEQCRAALSSVEQRRGERRD